MQNAPDLKISVKGTTRVLGIIGDPIAHSLSPTMQNAAIAAAGIDAVYVPFHVKPDAIEQAIAALRALDILGINVTVPHKESVMPFLDHIDSEAELIGAVNTIVNENGRLVGYNTDGRGFLQALELDLGFVPEGKSSVVLGAGGATRAAVEALARAGADEVVVVNRTPKKAEQIVAEFEPHFPKTRFAALPFDNGAEIADAFAGADLLVNSTTCGLHGEQFQVPTIEKLRSDAVFFDMVYAPQLTPIQNLAKVRGLVFADGRGMLAGQGDAAFELWFGQAAPAGIMRSVIME